MLLWKRRVAYYGNHHPRHYVSVAVASSPQLVMLISSLPGLHSLLIQLHCHHKYYIFVIILWGSVCSRGYKSVKMGKRKMIYWLELRAVQRDCKASLWWSSLDSYQGWLASLCVRFVMESQALGLAPLHGMPVEHSHGLRASSFQSSPSRSCPLEGKMGSWQPKVSQSSPGHVAHLPADAQLIPFSPKW